MVDRSAAYSSPIGNVLDGVESLSCGNTDNGRGSTSDDGDGKRVKTLVQGPLLNCAVVRVDRGSRDSNGGAGEESGDESELHFE